MSNMKEVDCRLTNVTVELPETPPLDPEVVEAFRRAFDELCFRLLCPPAPEPKPKRETRRQYGIFADFDMMT